MFKNWSVGALAVLARAVRSVPDRTIELVDVVNAVEGGYLASTIHLPGSTGWSKETLDAFAAAEEAARRAGLGRVGVIALMAGVINVAVKEPETIATERLVALVRRFYRTLGVPDGDADARSAIGVARVFGGNLSAMLTEHADAITLDEQSDGEAATLVPRRQPARQDQEKLRMASISPEVLLDHLDSEAVTRVRAYFSSGRYTGGQFERFAGGGDTLDVADRFTSNDVVALSMLSVRLPGQSSLELLYAKREDLNMLLSAIPNDRDLWDAQDKHIGPDSHASKLWEALIQIPGIGWVTAGKLMARKRPRLIPVYDRVVRESLGRSEGDEFWGPLRDVLAANPLIVGRLGAIRDETEVGADVSLLRILDVAIWMKGDGEAPPIPDAES